MTWFTVAETVEIADCSRTANREASWEEAGRYHGKNRASP
jgi:hypothetical protein